MPQEKKKYLLISKTKNKKRDDRNMTHEISLSKLGLSFQKNGNSFHDNQLNFSKKLDTIQNNLDQVILKINGQQKRRYLLKNLVNLMKMQSSKLQSQQKKSDLIQKQSYNKLIKKLQYDIDQIQQKCNQQVANIAFLNQQVNGKRSERVVYSNLFKTIQQQLKNTSEIYQQELVKSQIKKNCYRKNHNLTNQISKSNYKQSVSKRVSTVSVLPVEKKSIFQKSSLSKKNLFQNNKEKVGLKNFTRKFKESRFVTEVTFEPTYEFQKKQENTYRKNKQIQVFKTEIQRIKVHLGEDTYNSILNYGIKIKQQNKDLQEKIKSFDQQIQTLQREQKQILKMRKNNDVIQYSKLPFLKRGRGRDKTQVNTQTSHQTSICQKNNQDYLHQIAKIFMSSPNLRSIQTFLQIDKIIDSLNEGQNIRVANQRFQMRRTDSSSSKTMHHNGLQEIFGRMERMTQFQKLLDQQSFFQQYKKQVNRKTNIRCSKK